MSNLPFSRTRRVAQDLRMAVCFVAFLLGLESVCYAQSGAITIRDLPFSANEWVTRTSAAPDGSVDKTTQQIVLARASDGTVRREIHEASPGLDHVVGRPIIIISILNEDTKTSSAIFRGKSAVTAMDAPKAQSISVAATSKNSATRTSVVPASHEMLGFNGLQVVVHRSQYTVPADGSHETSRTITSELWYSPELRVPLKSSISDSSGTTTVTVLDDIRRQEPDPTLFHVSPEAKTVQK